MFKLHSGIYLIIFPPFFLDMDTLQRLGEEMNQSMASIGSSPSYEVGPIFCTTLYTTAEQPLFLLICHWSFPVI